MTLGFKPQFVSPILAGTKIHTIREDRGHRWEPGKIIHMATGVRTKSYNQFRQEKCISVQEIVIDHFNWMQGHIDIRIDGRSLILQEVMTLAHNDGFDSLEDFCKWFDKDFIGRIIHWTDKRY